MEVKKGTKAFWLFFYGQPFEDGVRTTLAVLLPALILSYFNLFLTGLTISLGAACVSLTDTPGPIIHRRNTMLFCLFFIFIVAAVTGFAQSSMLFMGIEVVFFTFFFSMYTVYGMRAAMVGNAALLTMVLTMDKPGEAGRVVVDSLLILCGGLWYMLMSLVAYKVRPYRTAQRALGESIRELSSFLSIKANFYNTETHLDEEYKKLLAQQIIVTEKQDNVRELLFKTRQIVEESTPEGRRLVLAFINTVDLFEDITAAYYNYHLLRQTYSHTGILNDIYRLAKELADELDKVGIAIYTNRSFYIQTNYENKLLDIKKKIDALKETSSATSHLVLKKMLVNIRKIILRNTDLMRYFSDTPEPIKESKAATHTLFVGHQSLDPKIFWNNFNYSSSVFRHALRVALACLVGYIIAKSFAKGYHSYWILMTVIFMLKPTFSLTKQRNTERIIGTLTGGFIGFVLLSLHPPEKLLFGIMVLLMIATYSLQRVKYLASIICMTPFILILFNFMGTGFVGLLQERIIDTIIGCFIAVLAGYLLFPDWESEQLTNHLQKTLEANTLYLQKIVEALEGKNIVLTDYKLTRKEAYINSANLSAAFQRMLSEPKSKQKNKNETHQFVVLNHILFSNLASVAASVINKPIRHSEQNLRTAKKTLSVLSECGQLLGLNMTHQVPHLHQEEEKFEQAEDLLLKDQLDFIHKLSLDIKKTIAAIVAA